jgi:hypothetical protein
MKLIFSIVTVLIVIASCNSKSKSAYSYSESIVKKEKDLVPSINKTEANVERFINTGNYDSISLAGANMEALVNAKILEIENAPAPTAIGAEEFKQAAIQYFSFMKSIYTGYKDLAGQQDDAGRLVVQDKLVKLMGRKQAAVEAMQAAQRRFAAANGFNIKNE